MQEINIETWDRKEHFLHFQKIDYPSYNLAFDVDITSLLPVVKENKLNFYYTMIFLTTLTAAEVKAFLYRYRDGKVFLHNSLDVSFTDINDDSELYKCINTRFSYNYREFIAMAEKASKNQKQFMVSRECDNIDDIIYITTIPWISFTGLVNPIHLDKNDSIPRFAWGRYYNRDNKMKLPYCVQASHAFVDGIHLAKFKQQLEDNMIGFKKFL